MDSSGKEIQIGVQSPGEPNFAVVPFEGKYSGWHPGDIIVGSTSAYAPYLSLITFDNENKTFSQNLKWIYLPVVASGAWGAFFFDTVGTFNYDLLYRAPTGEWMTISSDKTVKSIPKASIGAPESFGILSNDKNRWGPWAGWIYSGDESSNHFVIHPTNFTAVKVLRGLPFKIGAERVDVHMDGYGFLGANISESSSIYVSPDDMNGLDGSIILQSSPLEVKFTTGGCYKLQRNYQ